MIVNYSLVLSSNISREFDLRHSLYLHGQRLEWKSNVILRLANDTFSCFPHKFVIYFITPFPPERKKKNQELKLLDLSFFFSFFFYKDFFTEIAVKLNLSACEKCARLFILIFFFFNFANTFSQGQSIFLGEVGR